MAYINIEDKVPGSSDVNKRKVLYTDINQIKGALQVGSYDIKPNNIYMEGTELGFNGSTMGLRYNTSTSKLQLSNDGSSWVDLSSDVNNVSSFTAGETISVRDVVYLDSSDGKVYIADKSDSSKQDWIGIAEESGNAGDTIQVAVNSAIVGGFSGLTTGEVYQLGSSSGIEVGTNNIVGVALNSNQIKLIKVEIDDRINKLNTIYLYTDLDSSSFNASSSLGSPSASVSQEYTLGSIDSLTLQGVNYAEINISTFIKTQDTEGSGLTGLKLEIDKSNDGSSYTNIYSKEWKTNRAYGTSYTSVFNLSGEQNKTVIIPVDATDRSSGVYYKVRLIANSHSVSSGASDCEFETLKAYVKLKR